MFFIFLPKMPHLINPWNAILTLFAMIPLIHLNPSNPLAIFQNNNQLLLLCLPLAIIGVLWLQSNVTIPHGIDTSSGFDRLKTKVKIKTYCINILWCWENIFYKRTRESNKYNLSLTYTKLLKRLGYSL